MRVVLFLDHACNLRCSYCYNGPKFERRMPLEIARRGVDLAFEGPVPPQLGLFGGEPLLAMDLVKPVVAHARERTQILGTRMRIHVVTNGTLLGGETLDWLLENGIDIGLSLDGCRAAHDAGRRYADGRPSFDDVAAAAGRLRERHALRRVMGVVHPGNAEYLGETFDALLDLGATNLALNLDYGGAWDEGARARLDAGLTDLGDRYIEAWRRGATFGLTLIDTKIRTHLSGGYSPAARCDFGCDEVTVAPSGKLYPCDRLVGQDDRDELVIGHVETGIDTGLRGKLVARKNEVPEDCQACALVDRCKHWCGCVNHALTGDVGAVDGLLCWFEQRRIEEADRVAEVLYGERNPGFLRRFYGGF